jgi:hypothetical protein
MFWANKTSLSLPPCIEVSVTCHESESVSICVLGISHLHVSTIFRLYCGTVLMVWYVLWNCPDGVVCIVELS